MEYADNAAFTDSTTGDATVTNLKTGQLTLGTVHHFRVRAVNSVGNSDWSATVTATPRKPPGWLPITGLTPGDRSLTVTWSAPASDGGNPVDAYRVGIHPRAGGTWHYEFLNTPLTQLTHTIEYHLTDRLVNGMEYEVRVQARNAAGIGPWDHEYAPPPGRPTPPPSRK